MQQVIWAKISSEQAHGHPLWRKATQMCTMRKIIYFPQSSEEARVNSPREDDKHRSWQFLILSLDGVRIYPRCTAALCSVCYLMAWFRKDMLLLGGSVLHIRTQLFLGFACGAHHGDGLN